MVGKARGVCNLAGMGRVPTGWPWVWTSGRFRDIGDEERKRGSGTKGSTRGGGGSGRGQGGEDQGKGGGSEMIGGRV